MKKTVPKKTIDEIFGGSWHKDWQDLPDMCKQWLIDKNSNNRHRSGMTESLIESNWNRDRNSNLRQQSVELLYFRNTLLHPGVVLEIERRHSRMIAAIKEYEIALGNCDVAELEEELKRNSELAAQIQKPLVQKVADALEEGIKEGIKAALSENGLKGAVTKLEGDKKQVAIVAIKEQWLMWKADKLELTHWKGPHIKVTNTEFARQMQEKFPVLDTPKTITDLIRQWEKHT